MGFLRKKVKQIGRAIKKVVKKVGKAFGKLGIVGQIGLMMFLPTLGGSLWGSLGNFASSGTGFLNRAAGAIYNAGNAVGRVYKTVTEAISNGVNRATNFMKGDGFVLSPDKTSIFADGSNIKSAELNSKLSITDVGNSVAGGESVVIGKKVTAEPVKKSLLDKGKDYIAEGIEGAKEALSDPKTLVKESIESGAKSGLATKVSYDVAGDPPEQRVITTNFDVNSINSYASTGTFNTEDFTRGNQAYQALGSSWGAGSSIAAPFLTQEVFSGGDINYAKRVQQLRYT